MLGLEHRGCHFLLLLLGKSSALRFAPAADQASSKRILQLRSVSVAGSGICQNTTKQIE